MNKKQEEKTKGKSKRIKEQKKVRSKELRKLNKYIRNLCYRISLAFKFSTKFS